MDAYRATVDKRDQRAFLPKPIPDESLRKILQAARMTGSSKNREPNRLVVVRERATMRAMAAMGAWARWLADAAAVIVIVQTERHEFDAGRCAQNMMLAAWSEGVGSCPAQLPERELGRLLGVIQDRQLLVEATADRPPPDHRELRIDVLGARPGHEEEASLEVLEVVGRERVQALVVDGQDPA